MKNLNEINWTTESEGVFSYYDNNENRKYAKIFKPTETEEEISLGIGLIKSMNSAFKLNNEIYLECIGKDFNSKIEEENDKEIIYSFYSDDKLEEINDELQRRVSSITTLVIINNPDLAVLSFDDLIESLINLTKDDIKNELSELYYKES